jgi:hypothetical protein
MKSLLIFSDTFKDLFDTSDGLKVLLGILTKAGMIYPIVPWINFLNEDNSPYYWPTRFVPDWVYEDNLDRLPFILLEGYISALSMSSTMSSLGTGGVNPERF